ncbi:hypothetical protein KJ951_03420 [Patescibacteria group bacterium]|nr:hypothetical protein [Patescibacteria group bacterium]MBU1703428.1 hypothetical protein [Patescibacteria group bacterium]MBU1953633.1 hypothetical protein [Patescibacteria group bacterium]
MNRSNNFRSFGVAAISGALTLGACANQSAIQSARQANNSAQDSSEPPNKELFADRGPAAEKCPPETKCAPKKYLSPPQTAQDTTDLLIICQATRISALAFIEFQKQITSTKGCRVIQALHEQGDRIMEACMPVATMSAPPGSELFTIIQMIRIGLAEVQHQLSELRKGNSHCFPDNSKPPENDPRLPQDHKGKPLFDYLPRSALRK